MFAKTSRVSRVVFLAFALTALLATYYSLSLRGITQVSPHLSESSQQGNVKQAPPAKSPKVEQPKQLKPQQQKSSADLQRLCSQTTWTPGLYIQCHSNTRLDDEGKIAMHGGLNNVRNRLQSCLRIAIDAGAGVIMPNIATRSQTALKHLGDGEPVPASRYWDMKHMEKELGEKCPQLNVRYDIKGIDKSVAAPKRHYKDARYWSGRFRKTALEVLDKARVSVGSISIQEPVMITFGGIFYLSPS